MAVRDFTGRPTPLNLYDIAGSVQQGQMNREAVKGMKTRRRGQKTLNDLNKLKLRDYEEDRSWMRDDRRWDKTLRKWKEEDRPLIKKKLETETKRMEEMYGAEKLQVWDKVGSTQLRAARNKGDVARILKMLQENYEMPDELAKNIFMAVPDDPKEFADWIESYAYPEMAQEKSLADYKHGNQMAEIQARTQGGIELENRRGYWDMEQARERNKIYLDEDGNLRKTASAGNSQEEEQGLPSMKDMTMAQRIQIVKNYNEEYPIVDPVTGVRTNEQGQAAPTQDDYFLESIGIPKQTIAIERIRERAPYVDQPADVLADEIIKNKLSINDIEGDGGVYDTLLSVGENSKAIEIDRILKSRGYISGEEAKKPTIDDVVENKNTLNEITKEMPAKKKKVFSTFMNNLDKNITDTLTESQKSVYNFFIDMATNKNIDDKTLEELKKELTDRTKRNIGKAIP